MKWICLALLASVLPAQTPSISLIVNAATNLVPGLPNSGIAQGAMFVAYGSNMGPAVLTVVPSYPLNVSLAGTSVKVTVAGRTVDALPYYTSANQIAAILPSTTPVGTGTVTVSYNSTPSAPVPITVVASNVGMYTVNSQGTGEAVVTFPDYRYVTSSNAAHPGDIVILWANGLGPVQGDESRPPVSSDMTNVPLEVLIGGRPADVLFRGRNSCCSSLDQINVRIPDGAIGCRTPIVLKIGTQVSNTVAIPTSRSGPNCTPAFPSTDSAVFQSLLGKPQLTIAALTLLRNLISTRDTTGAPVTSRSDTSIGSFYRLNKPQPTSLAVFLEIPPLGSCSTTANAGQTTAGLQPGTVINLDVGPALTISGPNGTKVVPQSAGAPNYAYTANVGAGVAGNYLDPGAYSIQGTGGAEIGAFTARIDVPPALRWTNQDAVLTVNRQAGIRVTWTGGDPNGYVQISGQVSVTTAPNGAVAGRFDCFVRSQDGEFTVPPAVLLGLPAPGTSGTLSVTGVTPAPAFLGPGMDYGRLLFTAQSVNFGIVAFQ